MAFETLHYMKHHQKGRSGFMVSKLDMSKAYDRVEWKYLELVMKRVGFANRWMALMMSVFHRLVTRSLSIVSPHQSFTHLEASGKGTLSPLTCFFSVWKAFIAYFSMLQILAKSKESLYLRKVLGWYTSSSLTTACFSADLPLRNATRLKIFLVAMKELLVYSLTGQKPPSFSANQLHLNPLIKSKVSLGFKRSSNMKNTSAFLLKLEETKRPASCSSKKGFGPSCKVGKNNFFPKLGKMCC